MRLYHCGTARLLVGFLAVLLLLNTGCTLTTPQPTEINVTIEDGSNTYAVRLPLDSTVQQALTTAKIDLDELDRVDPPAYTILVEGIKVTVTRIREEIYEEKEVIPFERQTIKNESMPQGESRIVQVGVNGIDAVTWRRVYENGQEASLQVLRRVTEQEALPEILMIGSQSPFASFAVPGRLAYLLGGSAWLIEDKTGSRRPLVTTGDLDGRIFSLSPDGKWLLFTRKSEDEETINTLWAAAVDEDDSGLLVELEAANVIHFADWNPADPQVIAYSTVEPRPSAPGWQANNDLNLVRLLDSGKVEEIAVELETNMGGKYGWWGMDFAWSPDGLRMAYARPDSIGLLTLGQGETGGGSLSSLLDIAALQTGSDWAWVPGVAWGPDGNALFTVDHLPDPAVSNPEESQVFDLTALMLTGGVPVHIISQTGMFAYPLPSPLIETERGADFRVAYLQAIFPAQSEGSRYQLMVVDRDGSNRQILFPEEGASGLDPLRRWGAWSPDALEDSGSYALAVIYQNNLYIVDSLTGEYRQITGDNLVTRVDWR